MMYSFSDEDCACRFYDGCKSKCWIPIVKIETTQHYRNDRHYVKEIVYYSDGTDKAQYFILEPSCEDTIDKIPF